MRCEPGRHGSVSVSAQSDGTVRAPGLAALSLCCVECAACYPGFEDTAWYRCECGGVLDVEMPSARAAPASAGATWRQLFDRRAATAPLRMPDTADRLADRSGVWRYREWILPVPTERIVSRPEGNTGLYPVGLQNGAPGSVGYRQIGLFAGLEHFFPKHEGENPTGSFKDRGMAVGVTVARLRGARAVACASMGNTSASLAAYAAQIGMQSIVFLPAGQIASGKLAQALAYGARVLQIEGDFDAAMRLVERVCNDTGIYLLNSLNPFRVEGQKTLGLESVQQPGWQAPDWLLLPAGNLGNTSAIGRALRQAYELGVIDRLPRMPRSRQVGPIPSIAASRGGLRGVNGYMHRLWPRPSKLVIP